MVVCNAYDGPPRPSVAEYVMGLPILKAPAKRCTKCGKERKPQETQDNNKIILPPKQYIGYRTGAAIGQGTERKPCGGCRKFEGGLNGVPRVLETLLTCPDPTDCP